MSLNQHHDVLVDAVFLLQTEKKEEKEEEEAENDVFSSESLALKVPLAQRLCRQGGARHVCQ